MTVPKSIFFFWDKPDLPRDVQDNIASWRQHTEIDPQIYDDATALDYIGRVLGREASARFEKCSIPAMRSDYFRLCRAWHEGGLYVDAGMHCKRHPEFFFDGGFDLTCVRWWHGRVVNGIFSCPPQSPIIEEILETVSHNIDKEISNNVWLVTGPAVWIKIIKRHEANSNARINVREFQFFRSFVQPGKIRSSGKGSEGHWSALQRSMSIFHNPQHSPQQPAPAVPRRNKQQKRRLRLAKTHPGQ